jgi:hypothetical protein
MISRDQIYDALRMLGVDNWASLRRDMNYVCPRREWLQGKFRQTWKNTLFSMGLTEWKQEVWDCEDISDFCLGMVKADHAFFYQGPPAGIAFGGWGYIPDSSFDAEHPNGQGHWINMAVTSEDPIEISWFEPQIPQDGTEPVGLVTLSRKEILSCTSDVMARVR